MSGRKKPTGPAYSKKISKQDLQASAAVNEDMFRQMFGADVTVGDVVQISFDDTESGSRKSENMITARPYEFVKTGDRISNNIVEGFEKGEAEYRMGRNTPQGVEPIVTRVSFAYQSLDVFEAKGFTSLDKEVHDAVVSLYAAGNKVFSPAMVYRTMAGKSDSTFVPQEKIKEVTDSIHKCMASLITIDASEEAGIYGLEARYSQNLIYAKSVTLRTKGWEVSAFLLMDEPVLYKYAKLKHQLFAIPLRVLDTPPNKTNDVIVLQGYLIRVVESLRQHGNRQNSEVLYQTLYDLLDCQDAAKQKLQRVRNNVKAILDYWMRIAYISGYSETTRSRSRYSLLLDVIPGQYSLPGDTVTSE